MLFLRNVLEVTVGVIDATGQLTPMCGCTVTDRPLLGSPTLAEFRSVLTANGTALSQAQLMSKLSALPVSFAAIA